MDEAEYCHRLALMYRGKVIALGPPEELKDALHTHTLLLVESSDIFESLRALEGLPGASDVAVFGAGLHVTVTDAAEAAPRIRGVLAGRGIALHRLESIRPSMEDVFVAMIEAEERKTA